MYVCKYRRKCTVVYILCMCYSVIIYDNNVTQSTYINVCIFSTHSFLFKNNALLFGSSVEKITGTIASDSSLYYMFSLVINQ